MPQLAFANSFWQRFDVLEKPVRAGVRSDTLLLLNVVPHDGAYTWAANRLAALHRLRPMTQ
ncbi:hypothetical protein [Micromonospora sp. WMMD708]|uniref:hypothetical protein n=1 Tax=Micromonospora sp. WMMD708 TaxID=3403464 RepID=UPI003BF52C6B